MLIEFRATTPRIEITLPGGMTAADVKCIRVAFAQEPDLILVKVYDIRDPSKYIAHFVPGTQGQEIDYYEFPSGGSAIGQKDRLTAAGKLLIRLTEDEMNEFRAESVVKMQMRVLKSDDDVIADAPETIRIHAVYDDEVMEVPANGNL